MERQCARLSMRIKSDHVLIGMSSDYYSSRVAYREIEVAAVIWRTYELITRLLVGFPVSSLLSYHLNETHLALQACARAATSTDSHPLWLPLDLSRPCDASITTPYQHGALRSRRTMSDDYEGE